jgi:hypothetical protein
MSCRLMTLLRRGSICAVLVLSLATPILAKPLTAPGGKHPWGSTKAGAAPEMSLGMAADGLLLLGGATLLLLENYRRRHPSIS